MKNFVDKFTFIWQQDLYSCGKCCAEMVLENYMIWPDDMKRFYKLLNTNPKHGTNQSSLYQAFKYADYKVKVVSLANRALRKKDLEPLKNGWLGIACVNNNTHWVVLRGFGNKRGYGSKFVFVADPDSEFQSHFYDTFKDRIRKGSILYVRPK